MAEKEKKRYYWLKLYDDFFDSLRIKKLRKAERGDTYIIIYLKMQLKAMKSCGMLTFRGLEEDFAAELALDIDEDTRDVAATLDFLMSCDLLEIDNGDNYYLPFAESNVGSEGASTQRSRDCRERKKALQCNTDATQLQHSCNVEKETEKDTRDKRKSKSKNTDCEDESPRNPPRHKYGSYQNVLFSDEDMEKLKTEFPNDYSERIENLSQKGFTHFDALKL